jgi:hypothetical protein
VVCENYIAADGGLKKEVFINEIREIYLMEKKQSAAILQGFNNENSRLYICLIGLAAIFFL